MREGVYMCVSVCVGICTCMWGWGCSGHPAARWAALFLWKREGGQRESDLAAPIAGQGGWGRAATEPVPASDSSAVPPAAKVAPGEPRKLSGQPTL